MAKKKSTTTSKIVSAAWKLFYEQGYDHTTVDEIIKASGTSKGTFYQAIVKLIENQPIVCEKESEP